MLRACLRHYQPPHMAGRPYCARGVHAGLPGQVPRPHRGRRADLTMAVEAAWRADAMAKHQDYVREYVLRIGRAVFALLPSPPVW